MRLRNMTMVTMTMNMVAPNNKAVALRGLMPLHMSLFDNIVDLVRCERTMNRWIPLTMMEFLLLDVDRVLRDGRLPLSGPFLIERS